ncbi:MAG TPA: hypothetical protein VLD61_01840 [Methylomirabilota bacterium]|nr:hypothetical protein [Methylomirabilota bacterium]
MMAGSLLAGARAAPGVESRMRLPVGDVEAMVAARPAGTSLEEVLGVVEVFASGSLTAEIYVLEDVGGKRIAIAPRSIKERFRSPGAAPAGSGGDRGSPPGVG